MDEYLSRQDAAQLLKVSVSTFDRWAREADPPLPMFRGPSGRTVRYLRADVMDLLHAVED